MRASKDTESRVRVLNEEEDGLKVNIMNKDNEDKRDKKAFATLVIFE